MEETLLLKLGYINRCDDTTVKHLTADLLEKLMLSEDVKELITQIKNAKNDAVIAALKKNLPSVFFQCVMPENGKRPKRETAIASGLCIHDYDHMAEAPDVWYWKNLSGREEELNILFAHVTPSGKGLRLVTTMNEGEDTVKCQQRYASMLNLKADAHVKDVTRMSFLPSKDYVLYLNANALFDRTVTFSKSGLTKGPGLFVSDSPNFCNAKSAEVVNDDMPCIAESFTYEGIKYSSIIEALLQRLATMGQPVEGERNVDLYGLVRELRHICEYQFYKVYTLVAPYFKSLPDMEIRRTVNSALASNGRTMTPVMHGILAELRNQGADMDAVADGMKEAKLPKVSEVEEMILSKYPKYMRNQVFMAMQPIWGVYGTHVRFDYCNGRCNSLSFMTSVVGKSGSGKAFAADLFDKMTGRFRIEDAVERQKANEYLDNFNKAGEGSEKPNDPRPRVRLYGDDITTSQLLDYLDNLNGEHGLQFTEEVVRILKAKKSMWGDNDDLYCKSFDNGIGGKESKSKQTRNIRIPIYLNTLFCGTPGAMHKFYSNPEGGLNNRVIFTFMPNVRIKGFPVYRKFTAEDQQMFDEVCDRLWNAGMDGKKIELGWLEKAIISIKSKWDKADDENPDEVWYDMGKRSLIVAMRVGVLQWLLRGCPEDKKSISDIIKVVKWMADTMRANVYRFSGHEYEKIAEQDNAIQRQTATRMTKNKKLFSLLPDEFTIQDIIALRIKNGESSSVHMIVSRWMSDGMIVSVSRGRYRKVKVLAA